MDEGKIILKGTTVCLPSGHSVYYTPGKDFQKVQVDQAIKEIKQSNLLREVITEDDLAATPMEEVEAYLASIKERNRMTELICQLKLATYDLNDEVPN